MLYKYYPPERLDFFETLSVRFTIPDDFSDRFDSVGGADNSSTASLRRSRFRQRLGIFCLTEDPDNQLMWVHYAARHTGFVVGFDPLAALFSDGDGILENVRYETPPQGISRTSREYCFYKEKGWSYEDEWRCVRIMKPRESHDVGLLGPEIREVIVGAEMTSPNITLVLEYAALEIPDCNFTVWKSEIDLGARCMRHGVYPYSVCATCHGAGRTRHS